MFAKIASLAVDNLSPMQMFAWIFEKYFQIIARLCAINVFMEDYRPNILTIIYVASINSFFVFFLWMLGSNDIVDVLQCASCMNFCIQGMVKYATLYFYGADFRKNVAQLKRMYCDNIFPTTMNFSLLLHWTAFLIGICKIIFITIFMVGGFMLIRPLAVYLLSNSVVMMIPVWVPYIDETTTMGYCISTAYHVFVTVLAVVGTIGSDSSIIIFVLYLFPMSEIFENMFGVIYESVKIPSLRDSPDLKIFVRNIIQMHEEICSYNLRLSTMYYTQCTVEVNTNGFSLCACVFCILTIQWQPAYFLAFLSFMKLLSYCLLGTLAESASDRILRCIEQSNWYMLSVDEQRQICRMMLQAQRPAILMAGVEKLNFQLFVSIMKTVYSVSMLLSETVEN